MHGSKIFLAAATGVALLGASACASKNEAPAVDRTAELTQRIEKAEFAAMEAKQAAQEAQRTADEAKARADAANTAASTAAQDSNERVNRAFERSQEK